jgi:hypothetical protein
MSDELIEYRVRATERYIVTRFQKDANGSGIVERGTFTSPHVAHEVAYALAKDEHERLGWPIGDERIQYPRHPADGLAEVSCGEFRAPVAGVLEGAKDLIEVAAIGIDASGEVQVFSSTGTPQTLALFDRARSRIDEIASD